MIYKPHLAVMLPFALLAGRRWLVVFVTGATAALLVAISVAFYGADVWLQYQHNVSVLRTVILEDGTGVSIAWFRYSCSRDTSVQASRRPTAGRRLQRWLRLSSLCVRGGATSLLIFATPFCSLAHAWRPLPDGLRFGFGAFVVVWLLKAEKNTRLSPQHIRGAAARSCCCRC